MPTINYNLEIMKRQMNQFKKFLLIPALMAGSHIWAAEARFFNYANIFTIMTQDTVKKTPVILEEVVLEPIKVLFITDTASMNALSKMFERDYAELFKFIGENQLKADKTMAFYLNYQDPISVEVAVAVDRLPDQPTGRVRSKVIAGGKALVAHYTGPYEKMELPYNEITNWVKSNNKQTRGLPFEVYLNDPGSVKDKSELKTDIYQMLQ